MTAPATVVTLTLNPALDRVMDLGTPLRVGELQRVSEVREQAGGKGVNVARAVRALGGEVLTAGVLGGFSGRKFEALLNYEGLTGQFLWSGAGETRQCHILLEGTGIHPTEINETGFVVSVDLLARLLSGLPPGPLVMSGSLPPGLTPAEFQTLLRLRPGAVVDTSGPALTAALESGKVSLIKPNRAELEAITHTGAGLRTARELYAQHGTRILLTLGEGGAALIGEQTVQATAPQIRAVNPVGSGDSLLGAFVWAEQQGLSPAEALRWGVAAGTANAQAGGPQALKRRQVEVLLKHVILNIP